jgi:hypothetical protein
VAQKVYSNFFLVGVCGVCKNLKSTSTKHFRKCCTIYLALSTWVPIAGLSNTTSFLPRHVKPKSAQAWNFLVEVPAGPENGCINRQVPV